MSLLYGQETEIVIGAAFEVYREMGRGFLESGYQECLVQEFLIRGIPFQSQQVVELFYKGCLLRQKYVPDFLCHDKIVIELKAVQALVAEHESQVMNYLRATRFRVGLLFNFGHYPGFQFKRIIM